MRIPLTTLAGLAVYFVYSSSFADTTSALFAAFG